MFFLGVTFADVEARRLFDLARLLLEPEFARPSHITLRGPYKKRNDIGANLIGKQIEPFTISRPSNFFNERQNTVYLRAEIPFVADYWHKPDYPSGIPHISIYDGKDLTLAWQILMVLRQYPWNMEFKSSPMAIIDSKQRIETKFIRDFHDFDAALSLVSEKSYSIEAIKTLHIGQRLHLLENICERIHAMYTA